jgi:hypothetical protein
VRLIQYTPARASGIADFLSVGGLRCAITSSEVCLVGWCRRGSTRSRVLNCWLYQIFTTFQLYGVTYWCKSRYMNMGMLFTFQFSVMIIMCRRGGGRRCSNIPNVPRASECLEALPYMFKSHLDIVLSSASSRESGLCRSVVVLLKNACARVCRFILPVPPFARWYDHPSFFVCRSCGATHYVVLMLAVASFPEPPMYFSF